MKRVTVRGPQGIGDLYWIYQKLCLHVDVIDWEILIVTDDALQRRSCDWLKLLPKTGWVNYVQVANAEYENLWKTSHRIGGFDFDLNKIEPQNYCVNRWLEEGVRLEAIDPDYAVDWDALPEVVPWSEQVDHTMPEEYDVLYVSKSVIDPHVYGNPARFGVWQIEQWVEFVGLWRARYGERPLVLIDAAYDEPLMRILQRALAGETPVSSWMDQAPENVLSLLKGSRAFVGYQSGLGILAEAAGVKQLMLYFNYLDAMHYTWCAPDSRETQYHAARFGDGPSTVIENLKLEL